MLLEHNAWVRSGTSFALKIALQNTIHLINNAFTSNVQDGWELRNQEQYVLILLVGIQTVLILFHVVHLCSHSKEDAIQNAHLELL